MRKKLGVLLGGILVAGALFGCDPLTVHKVSTTIFDGVPSMPSAEQYCEEFHQQKLVDERTGAEKKKRESDLANSGSVHPPYKEKRCERCHDKSKDSGLIKPKNEICFVCHPTILNHGGFQHGPAAVGSCLECHDPHSSTNPSLLKTEKAKLCASCHKEPRVAAAMHDKVIAAGMFCMDCHDPHAGSVKFFLR